MQHQIDNLYPTLADNHPLSIQAKSFGLTIKLGAHYLNLYRNTQIIRIALKHLVYAGDIISSFEYYFSAVKPQSFNQYEIVDYSTPRFHNVIGFDLMPVVFPSFSEPLVTTNQYLHFANLKPGDTAIDLGAYSGLTSIVFKEIVGNLGKVIAVDADSENMKAILENTKLYKSITGNNIDIINGAVWSHCNGLSFSTEGNMGSSASEIVGVNRGSVDVIKSYTLSALCEIGKVNSVDFIKCDVEGAEAVIFEDETFFQSHRPRIIIETHLKDGIETTEKCISDLTKFGYECRKIIQTGVTLPLVECYPKSI
ncbi:FkbM family methyltransferase [Planktomarina temperata]|nr:FkbM family methyltransferase [Planktomarina temperata]